MTDHERRGLANYTALCEYVAAAAAGSDAVRPGENAGAAAIRWHKELLAARAELTAIQTAKTAYETDTEWQDRLDQCEAIQLLLDDAEPVKAARKRKAVAS